MLSRYWLLGPLGFVAVFAAAPAADAPRNTTVITWKKTVLDRVFRSEGVAIADVNRDGKMDVLNGEVWYEAPDWKMHEIRTPGNYGDGLRGYSNSFACWADDINGDGWPDLIVIGFPGAPCHWFENPKGRSGPWQQHEIWHSACNETPQYVDLFGNGQRVLLMGVQPKGKDHEGQMAWFSPGKDPRLPWGMHPISEPSLPAREVPGSLKLGEIDVSYTLKVPSKEVAGTFKFSHGLGVGDINGDGRLDVIISNGWWEQPPKQDGTPWTFHAANLGENCADMYAYDVDGDGKADVISSSAHKFGIWWYQQRPGANGGPPVFLKHDLFPKLVSETHALHCVDINGDGLKDLVTGKRWWSHGKSEPGSDMPARIYWFEANKKDGIIGFTPHVIDEDSGIGTQFVVADVNGDGLPDVVTSNKKGTCVIEQVRSAK